MNILMMKRKMKSMKVKELIEMLEKADPDSTVYITCGNDDAFEYRIDIVQVYEVKNISEIPEGKSNHTGTYIET